MFKKFKKFFYLWREYDILPIACFYTAASIYGGGMSDGG